MSIQPLRHLLLLAALGVPAAAAELSVRLDPRLELHGLSRALRGAEPAVPAACPELQEYSRRAQSLFKGLRGKAELVPSAPASVGDSVLVRRTDPPRLAPFLAEYAGASDAFGGRRRLEQWLQALRDLSDAADFPRFHARESAAANAGLGRVREALLRLGALEAGERYTGLHHHGRFQVLVRAIEPTSDMGLPVMIEAGEDGSSELAWVLSACPATDESAARNQAAGMLVSVWHEGLHELLDPFGDLYARRLRALPGYDVREYIAQAATLRLVERERERMDGLELALNTRKELERPVLDALAKKLAEYEQSGGKTTLAAFYPRLLEAFPQKGGARPPEPADWLVELVEAFASDGARRAAVERLNAALAGNQDAELLERRAALLWLLGNPEAAAKDAAAASGPRGLGLQGIIALDSGRTEEGRMLLGEAKKRCGEPALCADFEFWLAPQPPVSAEEAASSPAPAQAASRRVPVPQARREAITLFGKGEFQLALEALEAADDLDDLDLLADQAALLHSLRRFREALAVYARMEALTTLKGTPSRREGEGRKPALRWARATAREGRASVLEATGEPAEAAKVLRDALSAGGSDWPRRSAAAIRLKRLERRRKN